MLILWLKIVVALGLVTWYSFSIGDNIARKDGFNNQFYAAQYGSY